MSNEVNDEGMECPRCDGIGWIEYADPELGQDEYECPDCKGTGWLDKEDIERLKQKEKSIRINDLIYRRGHL